MHMEDFALSKYALNAQDFLLRYQLGLDGT